jgi:hypothetical protein
MTAFLNSIQTLTQQIRKDQSLDPFSFDLIQLANVSDKERSLIQEEVKDIKLIHVDEFWEFTEEIYKRLMLKTISQDLYDFFMKLQTSLNESLEITYEFKSWKTFVLKSSNGQETQLTLQTLYAEHQIQNLLNHLGIQDPTWINDLYDFDYKFNFESEVESLFRNLAFDCWEKVKIKIHNQQKATIKEVNGGSFTYDLNTRQPKQ